MKNPKRFEMLLSLTKYEASPIESTKSENTPYVIEVDYSAPGHYKNGDAFVKIFTNGKLNNLQFFGWTFPFFLKGRYHMPGSYSSCFTEIDCLTREGETSTFRIESRNEGWSEIDFAELIFNKIIHLSYCKNLKQYESINQLDNTYLIEHFNTSPLENCIKLSQALLDCKESIQSSLEFDDVDLVVTQSLTNRAKSKFKDLQSLLANSELKL